MKIFEKIFGSQPQKPKTTTPSEKLNLTREQRTQISKNAFAEVGWGEGSVLNIPDENNDIVSQKNIGWKIEDFTTLQAGQAPQNPEISPGEIIPAARLIAPVGNDFTTVTLYDLLKVNQPTQAKTKTGEKTATKTSNDRPDLLH